MGELTRGLGVRAAALLSMIAAAVLGVIAMIKPLSEPFYAVLAASFLQGRLDVSLQRYDVSVFQDHAFYAMGPLPSVLLMPVVAVLGQAIPNTFVGIPAVLACLPALNRILRTLEVDPRDTGWWKIAAIAGTPLLAYAALDSGYFAAGVVVVAFLSWALALALEGRQPLLVGFLVGLAAATRADAAFAIIPLVLMARQRGARFRDPGLMLAGLAPAILFLAAYNQARFGSPFESGYAYQRLVNPWLDDARRYGLISIQHLPKNLFFLLLAGPVPAGGSYAPVLKWPWLVPDPWGTSAFLISPWLVLAFWARGRRAGLMVLGVVLVLLPSLFYYGIGWIQFGYRYGLDALPFAWVLAVLGAQRLGLGGRRLVAFVVAAMVVNLWGALWLVRLWGQAFYS